MTRREFIIKGMLASIGIVLLDVFWFEKSSIHWKKIDLSTNNKNKIKIVQLTDLHFNDNDRKHKNIAKRINSINPDLLVFTGDSIESNVYLPDFNNFLKLINHNIKKYSIMGNWEYWGNIDIERLTKIYADNNCELLINQNKQITLKNRNITIIGTDDYIAGSVDFNQAVKNLLPSDYTVLLSHCPKYRDIIIEEKNNLKIDLILSGHTHGGQINLLGFAPFKPQGSGKYLKGLYEDCEPKMYVSKGVGTSVLPVRFGSRAEIPIFEI